MIKNKFENIKRITSVFLIIIMAASISSCNKNNDETEKADTFAEGITVEGVDISGLTLAEATEKLSIQIESDKDIILKINESEYKIPFDEIGGVIDYERALSEAMETEKDIKITYLCDRELLKERISKVNEEIANSDNKFIIDIDKTSDKIIDCLSKGDLEPITPIKAENEVAEEKTLIGSFSTAFSANDKNRNENLRVACEKINGIVLQRVIFLI